MTSAIIDLMEKEGKPLSIAEIEHKLDLPDKILYSELNNLSKTGKIVRVTLEEIIRDEK